MLSIYIIPVVINLLTLSTSVQTSTIVIEVTGDCQTFGHQIAQNHGYRFVRQIFNGFCEIEEDPTSVNYKRHRRSIENGIDPAHIISKDRRVRWAESQQPKIRQKREFVLDDPQWNNMWYLSRHLQKPSLPDLNATGAWQLGYTGRGHVVTFLDDGLEFDHPDLSENYDKDASTDINGNDDDPSPRYDPTNENKHGTRCAGEVAAKANNKICGVGVAYHARVGGIRMLDGDVTDSVEARSISHRPDHVDIYSASWGPDDNGMVVDGPGPLARKAFENGIREGRGGKGSIYVWASGNGGRAQDSCACDGYINSIYTIAISSVTETGSKPWYLEECAATFAAAYSSGSGGGLEHEIITTDLHHECTIHHSGTSAAAPLAAAIYALVLEANSNLTWRDIMHITAFGSRPFAILSNTDYVHNAAGFNISSKYGFGLMDAGLMTWYAAGWKNVPPMATCRSSKITPQLKIKPNSDETMVLDLSQCRTADSSKENDEVNFIEQVQLIVTLATERRGDMEIYLESPSKTTTKILPTRANDGNNQGFQDWSFLSVQLWGEQPHGSWKIRVINTGTGSASLISYQIIVHGTRDDPKSAISDSNRNQSTCHIECQPDEPCGSNATSCTKCRHYRQQLSTGAYLCVGICPEGTYPSSTDKTCYPCHARCKSCRDSNESSCLNCKSDTFLLPEKTQCVDACPAAYHTDRKLGKCIPCKTGCATCTEDSNICSTCHANFTLKSINCVKAEKTCDLSDYFDVDAGLCRWCDSRCETCSGPREYHCRSCNKNSKYSMLQVTSCVASCSPGFYLDKVSSACLPCHESCSECTSATDSNCTDCKIGYVYIPNTKRCEKNSGQPVFRDPTTGESQFCHVSCSQCKGPKATDCIACDPVGKVLLADGHCVDQCPDGFYRNRTQIQMIETSICSACSIGCQYCSGPDDCSMCVSKEKYSLNNGICVPLCPSGSFAENGKCEQCRSPCATCSSAMDCLSCQDSLFLLNGTCSGSCPNGYHPQNQQCHECHPMCSSCTGPSEDDCLNCSDGFIFNEKTKRCVSQCANGNYFDKTDRRCHMCMENCLECLHPGTFCRRCAFPMSLDMNRHQCVQCCTSNVTTKDCCQCPSIWDGTCLHELLKPSIHSSGSWWSSPLDLIRNRFTQLDELHQRKVFISLIVILVLLLVFVGVLCAYMVCLYFRWKRYQKKVYDTAEYIPLQSTDYEDEKTLTE